MTQHPWAAGSQPPNGTAWWWGSTSLSWPEVCSLTVTTRGLLLPLDKRLNQFLLHDFQSLRYQKRELCPLSFSLQSYSTASTDWLQSSKQPVVWRRGWNCPWTLKYFHLPWEPCPDLGGSTLKLKEFRRIETEKKVMASWHPVTEVFLTLLLSVG